MYENLEFCPESTQCVMKKKCIGIRIIGLYEHYTLGIKPDYIKQYGKNALGGFQIVVINPISRGWEYIPIKKEDYPKEVKDYIKKEKWVEYTTLCR